MFVPPENRKKGFENWKAILIDDYCKTFIFWH